MRRTFVTERLGIEPDSLWRHYNFANALAAQGRLEEAIAQYQKTVAVQADYAPAHNNLGNLLMQRGRSEEALQHYRKAAQILPGNLKTLNNLVATLIATGRFNEAAARCRESLAIHPDNAELHYHLAVAARGQGRLSEAAEQLRATLKVNPRYGGAQNDLAWLLATCPQAELRKGSEAIEHAQQAVQLSGGKRAEVLDTLAAAYAEAGRFAEALATARKALDLARQEDAKDLTRALQGRIACYEVGKPFREAAAAMAPPKPKP